MSDKLSRISSGNRVFPTLSRLAFSMRPTSEVLIPRPQHPLPIEGLPIWKFMSLAQKIPVYPAPPGAVVFSRDRLGKSLIRKKPPNAPFQVEDRWLHEKPPYDPLHDPNLRRYLYRPDVREFLETHNLATVSGHAICNIKEFNKQRLVLKRLHLIKIQKEREEMENLDYERRLLTMTSRAEEVRMNRIRRMMLKEQRFKLRKEELELLQRQLVRTCTDRLLQDETRYEELQQSRKLMMEYRQTVSVKVAAVNRQKYHKLRFEEEKKRLLRVVQWVIEDRARQERRLEEAEEKKFSKEVELANWWERKKEAQETRLVREHDMLEEAERDLKERAWQREERVSRGIELSRELFLEKQRELRIRRREEKMKEKKTRTSQELIEEKFGVGTCEVFESQWDVVACLRTLVGVLTQRLHTRHEKDVLDYRIQEAKAELKAEIIRKIETRNFVRSILGTICSGVDIDRMRKVLHTSVKKVVECAAEAYLRIHSKMEHKTEKKSRPSKESSDEAKADHSRSSSPTAEEEAEEYGSDLLTTSQKFQMSSVTIQPVQDDLIRVATNLKQILGKHVLINVIEAARGRTTLKELPPDQDDINEIVDILLPLFAEALRKFTDIKSSDLIKKAAKGLANAAFTEAQKDVDVLSLAVNMKNLGRSIVPISSIPVLLSSFVMSDDVNIDGSSVQPPQCVGVISVVITQVVIDLVSLWNCLFKKQATDSCVPKLVKLLAVVGMVNSGTTENENGKKVDEGDQIKGVSRSSQIRRSRGSVTNVVVPCYNGTELNLDADTVSRGLTAIAVKHVPDEINQFRKESVDSDIQQRPVTSTTSIRINVSGIRRQRSSSISTTTSSLNQQSRVLSAQISRTSKNEIVPRNSFWDVHRPELAKVKELKSLSLESIEQMFEAHAALSNDTEALDEETSCETLNEEAETQDSKISGYLDSSLSVTNIDDDDGDIKLIHHSDPSLEIPDIEAPESKMLRELERSFQLDDADLDPSDVLHPSEAHISLLEAYSMPKGVNVTASKESLSSSSSEEGKEETPESSDKSLTQEPYYTDSVRVIEPPPVRPQLDKTTPDEDTSLPAGVIQVTDSEFEDLKLKIPLCTKGEAFARTEDPENIWATSSILLPQHIAQNAITAVSLAGFFIEHKEQKSIPRSQQKSLRKDADASESETTNKNEDGT